MLPVFMLSPGGRSARVPSPPAPTILLTSFKQGGASRVRSTFWGPGGSCKDCRPAGLWEWVAPLSAPLWGSALPSLSLPMWEPVQTMPPEDENVFPPPHNQEVIPFLTGSDLVTLSQP